MQFPDRTPIVVRQAVRGFIRRRRLVHFVTIAMVGVSVCVGLFLVFALIDRVAVWSVTWRSIGPLLVKATAAVTLLALLRTLLRHEDPFEAAIHLDAHLPENRDLWASSINFAERSEKGIHRHWIDDLLTRADEQTHSPNVAGAVSNRGLLNASAAIYATLLVAGLISMSSYFGMPLLWLRFWNPNANLPRDSVIQVVIADAPEDFALTTEPQVLRILPEGDDLVLKVHLSSRKGQSQKLPEPQLQVLNADGTSEFIEFARHGSEWIYTRPETASPVEFRISAGDALTQIFRVNVVPRIRFSKFLYSVRYPGYAKLKDIKDSPLEGERLSLLEGSRLEFDLESDIPIKDIQAVFELLQTSDGDNQMTGKDKWLSEHALFNDQKKKADQKERPLRVKVRRGKLANFRMKADQSGILRVRAIGENGIPGRERICVIEAVKDTPPRIVVSGMPADSHIVPGELVGFHYRAEDDLAVTDIIMDWRTAGSARTHDLAGEFYINSDQLGQRIVAGSETIQRMNYKIYATAPFEMNLIVIDSKGQEASSQDYRIHLLRDSFAARFESGMEFFQKLDWSANLYNGRVNQLGNNLNIIKTVAGKGKTWPAGQDKLIQNFTDTASGMYPGLERERATHFFAGWPRRLQESITLLMTIHRCLDTPDIYYSFAKAIKSSAALDPLIEQVQKRIDAQKIIGAAWKQAIRAERERFAGESLLQQVRNLRQRLGRLDEVQSSKQVFEANLKFYVNEAGKLLSTGRALTALADSLTPALDQLESAVAASSPQRIQDTLRAIESKLNIHAPPMSQELITLLEQMRQTQFSNTAYRLRIGAAEALRFRSAESGFSPVQDFELSTLVITDDGSLPSNWHHLPVRPAEVWLTTQHLYQRIIDHHRDLRMNRFNLNPEAAQDMSAEIREEALVIQDMLTRAAGISEASRNELIAALQSIVQEPSEVASKVTSAEATLRKAYAADLKPLANEVTKRLRKVRDGLDSVATAYEAMAGKMEDELTKGGGDPDKFSWTSWVHQAVHLEARIRAVEIGYRQAHLIRMAEAFTHKPTVSKDEQWQQWLPWHRVQLLLLIDGQGGFDKVSSRFVSKTRKVIELLPKHCRTFAEQLKTHLVVLERTLAGQPQQFDFDAFMGETKTMGHLDLLEKEFNAVATAFEGKAADETAKLKQTRLGKIVSSEADVQTLQQILKSLGTQKADQQRIAAASDALKTSSNLDELAEDAQGLNRVFSSTASEKERALRLNEFNTSVRDRLDTLVGQVQLPQINMVRHNNVRDFTATARNFWPIRAIIDSFDRRWISRMQKAEVSLVRHLLHFSGSPDDQVALGLNYSRMVEQRAQQVSRERRRNRGISYLDQSDGPRLKLPRHIALELMRARNKRPPAQFKEESETYYKELLKDLGK